MGYWNFNISSRSTKPSKFRIYMLSITSFPQDLVPCPEDSTTWLVYTQSDWYVDSSAEIRACDPEEDDICCKIFNSIPF